MRLSPDHELMCSACSHDARGVTSHIPAIGTRKGQITAVLIDLAPIFEMVDHGVNGPGHKGCRGRTRNPG